MKKIITISRQFGAGGGSIGRAAADRLGYYYCDKDMILQTAIKAGNLTPEEVRRYDERVPHEFGFGQSLFDFYNRPLDERLFEAQKKAIIEVAEKGNCVIVGRNANVILQQFDSTLHVFVSATDYYRMNCLKDRMENSTEEQILEKMKVVDRARKRYCSYYTNTKFGASEYYDMCLKSSTLGMEQCVDIICQAAKN